MSGKEPFDRKKSGKPKIRTFIAVKLPDHVIRTLTGLQQDLKKYGFRIKWSRAENIHLTLKFLGDILPDDVEPVCRVVHEAVNGCTPISLCTRGVGFFPGIRRPRVLWTGISGQLDLLENMHYAIDEGLHSLGFAREERRYTGHLTLGRFKGQQDQEARLELIDVMQTYKDRISGEFIVDAVSVIKSDLKPQGPIYTNLSSIRLGQ